MTSLLLRITEKELRDLNKTGEVIIKDTLEIPCDDCNESVNIEIHIILEGE